MDEIKVFKKKGYYGYDYISIVNDMKCQNKNLDICVVTEISESCYSHKTSIRKFYIHKNDLQKHMSNSNYEEDKQYDVKNAIRFDEEIPTFDQTEINLIEDYDNISDESLIKIIKDVGVPNVKIRLGISSFEEKYGHYSYPLYLIYCLKSNEIYDESKRDDRYDDVGAFATRINSKEVDAYTRLFENKSTHNDKHQEIRYFFVKKEGDNPGISIHKIKSQIYAENGNVYINHRIEATLEHSIGEKGTCVKFNKKSTKEIDPLDFFNINSNSISYMDNKMFEKNEYQFIKDNIKYFKQSGIIKAMSFLKTDCINSAFLLTYICLALKFPILEQLVKAGQYNLFHSLYVELLEQRNKTSIIKRIKKLEELVDANATTSKKALRFPTYIGQYLSEKNSELSEYYFWRDVYELTNISKENFEDFVDSPEYCMVNLYTKAENSKICSILKYGYKIEKLYSYIIKQSGASVFSIGACINNLQDYLETCEILELEPDKYPRDLKDVHDKAAAALIAVKNRIDDEKIESVANQCHEYMESNKVESKEVTELMKELEIVFPASTVDLLEEGNKQHNCVGSYCNRVARGQTIIFFIRQKSDPEKSYITAEITSRGLGQCLLSNNRTVNNPQHVNFARSIAEKIKKGCNSGKIDSLQYQ